MVAAATVDPPQRRMRARFPANYEERRTQT